MEKKRRYDVKFNTIAWKNMRTILYADNLDDVYKILSEIHGKVTITESKWTLDPEYEPLPF